MPVYMTGPSSHSWWAMVVLMFVASSLYLAYVFSYLYLWTVSPEVWAPEGSPAPPGIWWPLASAGLFCLAIIAFILADRTLGAPGRPNPFTPLLVTAGALALSGAVGIEISGHWATGLRPTDSSYGAMVYMAAALTGQIAVAVAVMAGFTIARHFAEKLDAVRRGTFENTSLLVYYTAAQGLVGLLLVHGFPRLTG